MEHKNNKFTSAMALIVVFVTFLASALPGIKWKTIEVSPPTHDTIVIIIDTVDTVQMLREDTINAMAMAFAKQESNFNHQAVSPCGRWVGCLQLSEIIVREANRIIDSELFDYNDRYDKACSYEIFKIIQQHHNKNLDIDRAIDLWNPKCDHQYRESVKKNYCCNIHNYSLLENYFEIK